MPKPLPTTPSASRGGSPFRPAVTPPRRYDSPSRHGLLSPGPGRAVSSVMLQPATQPPPSVQWREGGVVERAVTVTKNEDGLIGMGFHGTKVGEVLPGGPADAAGILPGMVIRAINGERIVTQHDASSAFALCPRTFTMRVEEPLPAGWTVHADPRSGRVFYFHTQTRRSQWTQPTRTGSPAYAGAHARFSGGGGAGRVSESPGRTDSPRYSYSNAPAPIPQPPAFPPPSPTPASASTAAAAAVHLGNAAEMAARLAERRAQEEASQSLREQLQRMERDHTRACSDLAAQQARCGELDDEIARLRAEHTQKPVPAVTLYTVSPTPRPVGPVDRISPRRSPARRFPAAEPDIELRLCAAQDRIRKLEIERQAAHDRIVQLEQDNSRLRAALAVAESKKPKENPNWRKNRQVVIGQLLDRMTGNGKRRAYFNLWERWLRYVKQRERDQQQREADERARELERQLLLSEDRCTSLEQRLRELENRPPPPDRSRELADALQTARLAEQQLQELERLLRDAEQRARDAETQARDARQREQEAAERERRTEASLREEIAQLRLELNQRGRASPERAPRQVAECELEETQGRTRIEEKEDYVRMEMLIQWMDGEHQGSIGVEFITGEDGQRPSMHDLKERHMVISAMTPEGPAERAGLHVGDKLLWICPRPDKIPRGTAPEQSEHTRHLHQAKDLRDALCPTQHVYAGSRIRIGYCRGDDGVAESTDLTLDTNTASIAPTLRKYLVKLRHHGEPRARYEAMDMERVIDFSLRPGVLCRTMYRICGEIAENSNTGELTQSECRLAVRWFLVNVVRLPGLIADGEVDQVFRTQDNRRSGKLSFIAFFPSFKDAFRRALKKSEESSHDILSPVRSPARTGTYLRKSPVGSTPRLKGGSQQPASSESPARAASGGNLRDSSYASQREMAARADLPPSTLPPVGTARGQQMGRGASVASEPEMIVMDGSLGGSGSRLAPPGSRAASVLAHSARTAQGNPEAELADLERQRDQAIAEQDFDTAIILKQRIDELRVQLGVGGPSRAASSRQDLNLTAPQSSGRRTVDAQEFGTFGQSQMVTTQISPSGSPDRGDMSYRTASHRQSSMRGSGSATEMLALDASASDRQQSSSQRTGGGGGAAAGELAELERERDQAIAVNDFDRAMMLKPQIDILKARLAPPPQSQTHPQLPEPSAQSQTHPKKLRVRNCEWQCCNDDFDLQPDAHNGRPAWSNGQTDDNARRLIFYSREKSRWFISDRFEDDGFLEAPQDHPVPYGLQWTRGMNDAPTTCTPV